MDPFKLAPLHSTASAIDDSVKKPTLEHAWSSASDISRGSSRRGSNNSRMGAEASNNSVSDTSSLPYSGSTTPDIAGEVGGGTLGRSPATAGRLPSNRKLASSASQFSMSSHHTIVRAAADDSSAAANGGSVLLQRSVVRGRHRKGLDIVGETETDEFADELINNSAAFTSDAAGIISSVAASIATNENEAMSQLDNEEPSVVGGKAGGPLPPPLKTADTPTQTAQTSTHSPLKATLSRGISLDHAGPTCPSMQRSLDFLVATLSRHYMFSSLAPSELFRVVAAMQPTPATSGELVVQQGDIVHNAFYVVERGVFDVYGLPGSAAYEALAGNSGRTSTQSSALTATADTPTVAPTPTQIFLTSVCSGGTFGEAALMYKAPAELTVRAAMISTQSAADKDLSHQANNSFRGAGAVPAADSLQIAAFPGHDVKEVLRSPRGASLSIDLGSSPSPEKSSSVSTRGAAVTTVQKYSQEQLDTAEHLLWKLERPTFRKVLTTAASQNLQAINEALRSIPLFSQLTLPQLSKLAYAVREQHFTKGEHIIRKGEQGDSLYVLIEGDVVCTNIGSGASRIADVHLTRGACFGERALLLDEPRAADVIATSESAFVFKLDRYGVTQLLGPLQELLDRNVAINVLRSIPEFSKLNTDDYEHLALCMRTETFARDQVLLPGATRNDYLYVVRDGQIKDSDGRLYTSGDYFGLESACKADDIPSGSYICSAEKSTCYLFSVPDMAAACVSVSEALGIEAKQLPVSASENDRSRRSSGMPTVDSGSLPYLRSVAKPLEVDIHLEDLERLITVGVGTFGRVYMVRHTPTGNLYALKELKKETLVRLNQIRNVQYEKAVMAAVQHPFLLRLVNTFQNEEKLYMLTEYIHGGELFNLLGEYEKLTSPHARFYAAGVLSGLAHLHSIGIVYRDLKPENLLIDRQGYIRIVDFGFCKHVPEGERTYTLCGTPAYIAYEMVKGTGYTHAIDYWALGTLIYEMLVGYAPFEGEDQMSTFRNILSSKLEFPDWFSDIYARDIIRQLLARDVVDRLGCRREGVREIFEHPWFEDVDFDRLLTKSIEPPWLPELEAEDDARYFESYDESDAEEEVEDDNDAETPALDGDDGTDMMSPQDYDEVDSEAEDKFDFDADIPAHLQTHVDLNQLTRVGSRANNADLPWFEGF